MLERTLKTMRDIFLNQNDSSEIEVLRRTMNSASSYGYNWIEMFCKVYGRTAIILFISFFSIYIFYKENQKIKQRLALVIIISLVLVVTTGLLYLTNVGFNADRILATAIMFSSFIMVWVIYYIRDWKYRFNNIHIPAQLFIIALIIGLCVISIPAKYPSPYLLQQNDQFTLNEKMGLDWFMIHSQNQNVVGIGLDVVIMKLGFKQKTPPYHFGYDKTNLFGKSITTDTFYIKEKLDQLSYTDVWPKVAKYRWQPEDFDRLKIDRSVDKYYSNGETEILFVSTLG